MRAPLLTALLILGLVGVCRGEPRQVEFGSRNFIEYQPGNLPLIIGAPHGGTLEPSDMPDRTYGVTDRDANTQEMARMLARALEQKTGGTPHLIVCLLHRSKVDCNREVREAAQGRAQAEKTWSEWHGFINKAKTKVEEQFKGGLYIDFHGHRHKEARVELGYLISPDKLRLADDALEKQMLTIRQSSIRDLDLRSPASFTKLLRGPSSLGALLQERGYPSIPSPELPAPKADELYYRGGYNTETHGSREGGNISALQIECPWLGVRDTPENREKFIAALSEALPVWFEEHFGIPLSKAAKKN